MLVLSTNILNQPVLSLRAGGPIASVRAAIINPNNLKIEGFYCEDWLDKGRSAILLTQDIRDTLMQGFVVNDQEVLTDPTELVRLKDILAVDFQIMGKQVVTVTKEKVGKVTDFAVETTTFYIQKLYVGQSLFKSFSGGQLSVDRTQIVETTDQKIVIHDIQGHEKIAAPAAAPVS